MYSIEFSKAVEKDIEKLQKEDTKLLAKLWKYILDINKGNPYEGLGKPEGLKHDFSGWWSRQLSKKHRLIYKVEDQTLYILSCYGHYNDK